MAVSLLRVGITLSFLLLYIKNVSAQDSDEPTLEAFTITPEATASDPSLPGPSQVVQFSYVGCMGGPTGFGDSDVTDPMTLVEDWELMSIDQCAADCHNSAYAGVYDTLCLCGPPEALTDMSAYPDDNCQIPCPGRADEMCGGQSNIIFLSMYQNTQYTLPDNPLPASESMSPDSADGPSVTTITTSAASFADSTPDPITVLAPDPVPQDSITPTLISTTYTTLCPSPLCPTPYPSETATTITVLSTSTDFEDDNEDGSPLTVPMTTEVATYSYPYPNSDAAFTITETATFTIPDTDSIASLTLQVEAHLQSEIATESEVDPNPENGKSESEIDAIAAAAGIDLSESSPDAGTDADADTDTPTNSPAAVAPIPETEQPRGPFLPPPAKRDIEEATITEASTTYTLIQSKSKSESESESSPQHKKTLTLEQAGNATPFPALVRLLLNDTDAYPPYPVTNGTRNTTACGDTNETGWSATIAPTSTSSVGAMGPVIESQGARMGVAAGRLERGRHVKSLVGAVVVWAAIVGVGGLGFALA